MLITFQGRLCIRLPRGGGAAKYISLDAIIPAFLIPMMIACAALGFYLALIMLMTFLCILGFVYYYIKPIAPRTRFLFMWMLWSIVYLLILFESTVPLLELLPEENYLLILLVCISAFCLFKTRQKAKQNFVTQNSTSDNNLPNIAEEGEEQQQQSQDTSLLIDKDCNDDEDDYGGDRRHRSSSTTCQQCRKSVSPNTLHCTVCQACVKRYDHHNYWLDCCIGEANHRYYVFGLFFGFFALLVESYLTLTSVCHPFLIFRIFGIAILLPDDCSEVFDQYEMSISFIIAVYSLLIAVFISFTLTLQIYLISKGITFSEWRSGKIGNRKSVCWNWKAFICKFN